MNFTTKQYYFSDQRTDLIKKLLVKFRKSYTINEDTPDFDEFFKLLDLNG
jgi:hypothetical protein